MTPIERRLRERHFCEEHGVLHSEETGCRVCEYAGPPGRWRAMSRKPSSLSFTLKVLALIAIAFAIGFGASHLAEWATHAFGP